MKQKYMAIFVLIVVFLLASCGTAKQKDENDIQASQAESENTNQSEGDGEMAEKNYPQLTTEVAENEMLVQMNTNMGAIKIKLFPEQAPKTVENFVTHAKNDYYNGIIFHRVIQDFMIQGGDPTGTGRGGESIYGDSFEDEFSMELFNLRGALSMANAGPNTNGSQFFIVQNSHIDPRTKGQLEGAGFPKEIIDAYMENGGTPHLDHRHTVFGQVIEGMDVVDKIANVKTGAMDKPVEDVVIESIDVIKE
ncbi:peptidylprolyl isomerase [Bacillus sp. FJAT-50079]|uniref:peptidylprolyl isomerase n=1 Tax=Bacillus sp. FJAT-50079 TaxID=2833577 RepID=UPI001BC9A302|nr:peptidylprolyl isomerase [Bacillus sp. FJAT-50079]MBS4208557.1 peptidylprolyl isomerase [Bacillus sp. FJAT-50079]